MPTAIKPAEMPKIVRTSADSPHRELVAYTVALCTDEKRRVEECFTETLTGSTPEQKNKDFAAKSQAVRNAAKSVGARCTILIRDGKMYVQYAGKFVGMTDEQKAARAKSAAENKAKAEAAAKAGKPAAKAAK